LKRYEFNKFRTFAGIFQKTAKLEGLFSPRKIPARVADWRDQAGSLDADRTETDGRDPAVRIGK
jgi:hypothetical protein